MSRMTATFADLLRQLRTAAALSQEELAERAGVSLRGISDLERGVRRAPYLNTVRMLADALALNPEDRQALLAAARPGTVPETAGAPPTPAASLPLPLTTLLGREQDLVELIALLGPGNVRLLTLTGAGGSGKTRLALDVAARLQGTFPDGVVFVDLTPLRDARFVLAAIAEALGVRERPGQRLRETLTRVLAPMLLLLLLDNCEHVLGAAPEIAAMLASCPRLTVLATSREALRLRGERLFPVPPLPLPSSERVESVEAVARVPAVALFVERAIANHPGFVLSPENAPTVAAICRRLDGLPLAIELAAAWSNALPPELLLDRLEERLLVLTGGSRDLPARQRTMRDAIAWSYDLLALPEQRLFRHLAIFAGGWTLEAAQAVSGGDDELHILEGLEALARASLVQPVVQPDGEWRFGMLETLREFGLERLREEDDQGLATEQAHAGYFLSLAEQAYVGLVGAEQRTWLARLDAEDANIRAALEWTFEHGSTESAMRLARALWRYWSARGRLIEGRSWLERALSLPGVAEASLRVRADAHNALGNLLGDSAEYTRARQHYEEALALRREMADSDGIAGGLNNLGIVAAWLGDYDGALHLYRESLELCRARHDSFGMALCLTNLGDVLLTQGDFNGAQAYHEEAFRLRELVHDAAGSAYSVYNLGEIARLRGDTAGAARYLTDSLDRFEALGEKLGIAYAECSLGDLASREGDTTRAAQLLERALRTRKEIGDKRGVIECLEALAIAAIRSGDDQAGTRLLGAAWAEREALSCPVPPSTQNEHERALDGGRMRLGAAAVEALHVEGRLLTPEQALALAYEIVNRLDSRTAPRRL
jgi:predicted ATPase/transcriptional regulator with XRE-family HTH domain/Tfp pilus assembly protein PilF